MLIEVTSGGQVVLNQPDEFTHFAVRVDPLAAGQGVDREVLALMGRLDGPDHVWISQASLKSLAGSSRSPSWDMGLAKMVSFARTRGWVDEEDRIRAHIEKGDASSRPLPPVSADDFKAALRNLAGGVAILTTGQGEGRRGLTVTAVSSVSADPPTILVCVNASSGGHDAIIANGVFAVSLLGPQHEALAYRFAGRDGLAGVDRFAGETWESLRTGVPVLSDALCAIDCEMVARHAMGSHSLILGRVVGTRQREGNPLVNFQGQLQTLAMS